MSKYYIQGREIWMRSGDCAGKICEFNNEKLAQEFLDAINKQMSMQVYYEYDDEFTCPNCGYMNDNYDIKTLKFCPDCGQKIYWD